MRGLRSLVVLGVMAVLSACAPGYVGGPVYGGGGFYAQPAYGYAAPRYYAPQPRFYAPPPRFYAPPPRFYGSQPRFYGPPRHYGGGGYRGGHPGGGRHWRGG